MSRLPFCREVLCVCIFAFASAGVGVMVWDHFPGFSPSRPAALDFSADAEEPELARAQPLRIRHDFGIIAPNTSQTCVFRIPNTAGHVWTVQRVHTPCTCTVTSSSDRRVPPGGEFKIDVSYMSSPEDGDVVKRVEVWFNEEDAPLAHLEVVAQVRSALFLSEKRLDFAGVGWGSEPERSFEVLNYSGQMWKGLAASSDVGWLVVECRERKQSRSEGRPCQAWDVSVKVKTRALRLGGHEGQIWVTPNSPRATKKAVPVSVTLAAPVMPIPDQVFFGAIYKGKPATRRLLLRFTADSLPKDRGELTFTHDLGPVLDLKCEKGPGNSWTILATIHPEAVTADGLIAGRILRLSANPSQNSGHYPGPSWG